MSHNLVDVLDHAVDREYGFTSDTNPSLVCHDQHLSQKNHPVTLSGKGGVLTALRRPADFNVFSINLWADEDATSGAGIIITATNVTVAPGAKIHADGQGFPEGQGPEPGYTGHESAGGSIWLVPTPFPALGPSPLMEAAAAQTRVAVAEVEGKHVL